MASFRTGAVVLIRFPFTDGSAAKRRPALVLVDTNDSDLLLARITTETSTSRYDCKLNDWAKAGLKAPSFVRLHKLATLEKKFVEKELGILTAADWTCVLETWNELNRQIKAAMF